MKKIITDEDIKTQKELEQKLTNFMKGHNEINKENINVFEIAVQKDFFVERLLYINNKLFIFKEKIAIDQIISNGGVIIPYKQGVGNVTLNQRVARLEELFGGQQNQINGMQNQINGMQNQIDKMQIQIDKMQIQIDGIQNQIHTMHTDLSNKIDKLADIILDHIKNHK